jgi:transcriptional regulator with XRE-family HTH domain
MAYKSKLKITRESKGMTQAELAEKAGVNLRMVQNYEQGFKDINKATVLTALRLAEALECDVYDILNPGSGCKIQE